MTRHISADLVAPLVTVAFVAAVSVIAVGVARAIVVGRNAAAELAGAILLGLDLFLGAGLLRLAAGAELRALGLVAIVIAVRKVSGAGIKTAARAVSGMVGARVRA